MATKKYRRVPGNQASTYHPTTVGSHLEILTISGNACYSLEGLNIRNVIRPRENIPEWAQNSPCSESLSNSKCVLPEEINTASSC